MTQSGVSALSQGCKKLTTFISKVGLLVLVLFRTIIMEITVTTGLSTHWRWVHVQSGQKLPLLGGYQRPGMPEYNGVYIRYQETTQRMLMSTNVQDDGLAAICEGCPNIRYLCISNCPHLTDQTLVRDLISSTYPSYFLNVRLMLPITVLALWYWSVPVSVSSQMQDLL